VAKKIRGTNIPSQDAVLAQARIGFQSFLRQRTEVLKYDLWMRGQQRKIDGEPGEYDDGMPYAPRKAGNSLSEYDDISSRSHAPWAKLIVSALAQTCYMESARIRGQAKDTTLKAFDVLIENDWASRQVPVHRSAIGHGASFVKVLPATSRITGEDSAIVRGVSALRMAAFYDDLDDEWPVYALQCDQQPPNEFGIQDDVWAVQLIDEVTVHHLRVRGQGLDAGDWEYVSYEDPHNVGVTPVIRYTNLIDLDGKAMGEIAPIVPLLRRVDQDTFDRLMVQRYGAWKVRYASGMAEPKTDAEKKAAAAFLSIADMLVASDPDTKFGTLDATDIKGFIEATDADLRVLAAVTQTPPHHLLGLSANLQAEALAAAEAGLQRKSDDFKIVNGTQHERLLRLVAWIVGDEVTATAPNIEIRWKDTESRSLVQAADALTKLAQGLGVPVEMLWDRIPNWTDDDTARALELIESGAVDALIEQIAAIAAEEDAAAQAEQGKEDAGGNPSGGSSSGS
jgi:hypothetical protein